MLSVEQIEKFMIEAPNESWLSSKIMLPLVIFAHDEVTTNFINSTKEKIQDN